MKPTIRAVSIILLFCFLTSWFAPLSGQTSPSLTVVSTFETLHVAEASGVNIKNLLDQYNNLLQQQAPDSSYIAISSQAVQEQQSETANKNVSNVLRIVLVPAVALLLALVSLLFIEIARKTRQNRLLEMRISSS